MQAVLLLVVDFVIILYLMLIILQLVVDVLTQQPNMIHLLEEVVKIQQVDMQQFLGVVMEIHHLVIVHSLEEDSLTRQAVVGLQLEVVGIINQQLSHQL
jgi:hypothetical protein